MSWTQLVQSVCMVYGDHALPEQILEVEKEFGRRHWADADYS